MERSAGFSARGGSSYGLAAKAHAKFDSHERLVVPLMGFPGVELAGSNINPATIMLKGSPESVRADVRRLKKEMADVPNFILSTGCDLPRETPMENIRAFMEEGRRSGGV